MIQNLQNLKFLFLWYNYFFTLHSRTLNFITLAKCDFKSLQFLLCVCFLYIFRTYICVYTSSYLLVLSITTTMLPTKVEILLQLLFMSFSSPCYRKKRVRLCTCFGIRYEISSSRSLLLLQM